MKLEFKNNGIIKFEGTIEQLENNIDYIKVISNLNSLGINSIGGAIIAATEYNLRDVMDKKIAETMERKKIKKTKTEDKSKEN